MLRTGPSDVSLNKQVVSTLRKLASENRSGILTCQGDDAKRYIVLSGGGIVGARSTSKSERLGEVLMRSGHITEQHFVDVSLFVKKGRRLGDVLVEFQVIQKDQVEEFLRLQFLEISSSAILSSAKKMSFLESKKTHADLSSALNVLDVVMEAARRTPQIDTYISRLMEDQRLLVMTEKSMRLMNKIALQPQEAFILSRVNGEESPKSVFELSPLPEEQTARAILGHIYVGILELKENPNLHGLALKS